MSLYQKYRPKDLGEIKGNEGLIKSLMGLLADRNSVPHAFLFHGPSGCGKTTLARILASQLGCSGDDMREVDIADFRGIDTIREIRSKCQFKPTESSCRVWLLDEAHKLSTDAQNALLKILEDTPPHVFFILCTTDPQKLIETVRNRCTKYQVSYLSDSAMFAVLRNVARKEGQTLDKEIFDQIISTSLGSPRTALVILEQVLKVDPDYRLEMAKKNTEKQEEIITLCRALVDKKGWAEVRTILEGLKEQEAEDIRRIILGYCKAILLKRDFPFAARIMEEFWEPTYNIGFPGIVYACYNITKNP